MKIPKIMNHRLLGCFLVAAVFITSAHRVSAQPGSLGPWVQAQSLPYPIDGKPVAVAYQNRIYVLGGVASGTGPDDLDNSVHTAAVNQNGSLQAWQKTTSFTSGRWLHAATVDSSTATIYVIGGALQTSSLAGANDVQYARINSSGLVGTWTSTTPLPSGISGHAAFCHNGYVYVFRGNGQSGSASQGYFYARINPNGSVGNWAQGQLSFTKRRYFGAFAYNDHFYLLGGLAGSQGLTPKNEVWMTRVPQRSSMGYLPLNETEFWNVTSPFNVARFEHGTASANGFVYITGGESDIGIAPNRSDVQFAKIRSDGSLDSWQNTTALPSALSAHGSVICGGYLYVLGGDIPSGQSAYTETAAVRYAAILSASDTTPPKTQVSPAAGTQPASPVNVTLTANDVGGLAVMSIRWTTNGDDPRNPGAFFTIASSASFSLPIPATLKFSAIDAAGNVELPQTVKYSLGQTPPSGSRKFRWPVGGLVTQDFYDDYSGIGGGDFRDDVNQWRSRVSQGSNSDYSKSFTHNSGELNWDSNLDGIFDSHMHRKLHRGVDIAATGGVRPALAGIAYRYNWNGTTADFYGNRVVIDHGAGYYTLYAHLASFSGKLATIGNGQSAPVETSDVIGQVGKTAANGIHLHFEIRHSPDPGSAGYYAKEAHFIPVPNSLSVVSGSEIPFDYPGLGGTSLSIALVNSGGLNTPTTTTPTISANGTSVGFKNSPTFHLVDLATGVEQAENSDGHGTLGNGELFTPVFSADSTVKAFASDDSNLVSNDSNGMADVFVWTQTNGITERVSVSSATDEANGRSYDVGISADGRFVVFTSVATNLVANDTNHATDIFIRDRATNQTFLVSIDSSGMQGSGPSYSPSISTDGRFVAFISESPNLVAGDTNSVADVFVRDMQSNSTVLVSRAWNGALANGACRQPSISGDGRYIAYESDASNIVPNDSNGFSDICLYDSTAGTVQKLSAGPYGEEANGNSHNPRISSYGLRIAFTSDASNLSLNDTNGMPDLFVASFTAPPILDVALASNQIVLSWPTNAALYSLESTTNLNQPVVWSQMPTTPTVIGEQNFITNSILGGAQYYRLKK